MIVIKCALGC